MSSRGRKRPPAMTPEESRLLDGTLPADEAKRLENLIASDPQRADALDTYREAMDVWRDDAGRIDLDPDEIADQVLAAVGGSQGGGAAALPTWYAVAAMLLIGIGVIGTAAVRGSHARTPQRSSSPVASMEEALLDALADERMFPGLQEGK